MQQLVQEWDPSLNATPHEIGDGTLNPNHLATGIKKQIRSSTRPVFLGHLLFPQECAVVPTRAFLNLQHADFLIPPASPGRVDLAADGQMAPSRIADPPSIPSVEHFNDRGRTLG